MPCYSIYLNDFFIENMDGNAQYLSHIMRNSFFFYKKTVYFDNLKGQDFEIIAIKQH